MFPRPSIRRVAESLLDAADAALRPEAPAPGAEGAPCDSAAARATGRTTAPSAALGDAPCAHADASRDHPHRTRLRIQRVRRRGATPPRPQHCITPVTRPATAHEPHRAGSRER
jgi:hypothetical protein